MIDVEMRKITEEYRDLYNSLIKTYSHSPFGLRRVIGRIFEDAGAVVMDIMYQRNNILCLDDLPKSNNIFLQVLTDFDRDRVNKIRKLVNVIEVNNKQLIKILQKFLN